MEKLIVLPIVQYGFLGMSAVLLCIVVWLISKLLGVLKDTGRVIAANTEAVRDLTHMTRDLLLLNRTLYEKVITRPCIAREE